MKETAKSYEVRVKNGDFKKYLHGYGIDIGGGDDCLVLPPDVGGSVRLWDLKDGDAQYLHKIPDEKFDFVYSSHCLEHMRDLETAFTNWLRVCKKGGYLYICVPHEIYYEKSTWPSAFNSDHKHSFTLGTKSSLPENVEVREFLSRFHSWIEIIEVRENLMNYHFDWDTKIDQTADPEQKICAQIDIIVQKKDMTLSTKWRNRNRKNWFVDYWRVIFPIRIKSMLHENLPEPIRNTLKKLMGRK